MREERNPEEIRQEIINLAAEYFEKKFGESFIPGQSIVHPSGKLFGSEELQRGIEAVLDGWWTEGRFTKDFEGKFSKFLGAKYTFLTNSGSSANLLAMHSITDRVLGERRVKKGDEIIAVATAFPTTVAPILQCGAVPVFLDIEPIENGTYNIDCSKLDEAISERTKAIFIAHTLGNPFDLEKILQIKQKYNLWLIEDCCDALGSKYQDKNVGTFGDISTFSFYPAHHITMGEGGALSTSNGVLRKIALSFRNWGRDCWCDPGVDNTCGKRYGWKIGNLPEGYDHKNIYTRLGYNLKNTDLQAAIGLAQLSRLGDFTKRRKENFSYLKKRLEKYEDKIILPNSLPSTNPNWFGFVISVREKSGFTREEIVGYLTEKKVMSRSLFAGNITKHPCMEGVDYRVVGNLNNSDETMKRTFWIGVQPNINQEKIEYVANTFDGFFRR